MTFRVAHVNVARGYRGGERQTELLVRELAPYLSQVLIARRGQPLAASVDDIDVDVRAVSGHPLGTFLAARGADIIHVHEGRSVYATYLRHIVSGTPFIVTRRVTNRIKNHFLARVAYRSASRVVAVAPQVEEILLGYDGRVATAVICDCSSGLLANPEAVTRIKSGYADKFLVGHVAALDNKQKAQEHIIEVARRLRPSHPDIHFVLVGGGDDEAMLRQAARGLENLTFTGFVDNVGDYLAAFDIFILPSRKEGMGSILLDAMEHRLPIVASRVGGVPAVVHDGENGLLIEPERPDELEAAILRLRRSPGLCRRLGERGAILAKRYSASAMAGKYLALYRWVLGIETPLVEPVR